MVFSDLVEKSFVFLNNFGFTVSSIQSEQVDYAANDLIISVQLDSVGYEIDVLFICNEDRLCIRLQDVLDYLRIHEIRGTYQLKGFSEIEMHKGLEYMASTTSTVMQSIEWNSKLLKDVHSFVSVRTANMLRAYNFDIDMHAADIAWKNKHYDEAKLLYEKHLPYLGKSQALRLKYIIDHGDKLS